MRAQEDAWKEKLRQLRIQEENEIEEAANRSLQNEVIDPVKADLEKMLQDSGDKVSDEGLEVLARWKLSL